MRERIGRQTAGGRGPWPRLRRGLAAMLALLALACLGVRGAAAEPRIALVVGNGAYSAVTALENPVGDARLIAEALTGLGFEVTLLEDATLADMRAGFARFGQALRSSGPETTGLFYYAGHGVQSFGANYLLPVDATLTDAADLDLVAIEAQTVLRQMASARNKTNIVILDACRNNPFAAIPELNDNGLAEMKAPTGTFLAYATAPGAVALDGLDGNSPFTRSLVENMGRPGVPIEQMFKQVRIEVLEKTGGAQTPWDTSSMTMDFAFAAGGAVDLGEEQLWTSVMASRDPVQVMLFMRAYPEGRHFEEARTLLAALMDSEMKAAAAAPAAPSAAPEAPEAPDAAEQAEFEAAQAAPTVEGWEAFLAAHPKSVFREIAETELAALIENRQHDPISAPEPEMPDYGEILFDVPLAAGGEPVAGRRISEIVGLSPLFAPIEGLPEEVWKGRQCAECHQWTKEALCEQGNFYVRQDEPMLLGEIHPLGGEFRRVLKVWAAQGCR